MFGDAIAGGEGQNGQPWAWPAAGPGSAHFGREAVSAFVNSLNAFFRFEPRAQRRHALGNAVGGHMHIAPESLAQLQRGDNAAGMSQQKPQRGQFFRRQMNRSSPRRSVPSGSRRKPANANPGSSEPGIAELRRCISSNAVLRTPGRPICRCYAIRQMRMDPLTGSAEPCVADVPGKKCSKAIEVLCCFAQFLYSIILADNGGVRKIFSVFQL